VLNATRRKPPDGSTHWSCRKLAGHLGISKDAVQRIWHRAGLKPHRLERYMASDDPDFERKAADIIGLYLQRGRYYERLLPEVSRLHQPATRSLRRWSFQREIVGAVVSSRSSMLRYRRPSARSRIKRARNNFSGWERTGLSHLLKFRPFRRV
jgi:hypothetical protein